MSNNTISRRIHHVAQYLDDQLIKKMNGKEFGMQLDEATDSNKYVPLIYYIRFLDDNIIAVDLLFCKSIVHMLDKFVTENYLDQEKCIGVCTDEA